MDCQNAYQLECWLQMPDSNLDTFLLNKTIQTKVNPIVIQAFISKSLQLWMRQDHFFQKDWEPPNTNLCTKQNWNKIISFFFCPRQDQDKTYLKISGETQSLSVFLMKEKIELFG